MIKTYFTEEFFLNLLKDLYKDKKEPINSSMIQEQHKNDKNFPEIKSFIRRFSSLENACSLANVPYIRKTTKGKSNEKTLKSYRKNEIYKNTKGEEFTIVEYNNANDIKVSFNSNPNFLIHTSWSNIIKGVVKNPYEKTIFNVACIGNEISKTNGVKIESYKVWYAMLQRCYSECYKNKPTYIDCSVCEEWLCYENFKKWYDKNYYRVENEIMNLDKDILVKGNKIYSPETCCFVPKRLNVLFVNTTNKDTIKRITDLYNNKIPHFIYNKIYENFIN